MDRDLVCGGCVPRTRRSLNTRDLVTRSWWYHLSEKCFAFSTAAHIGTISQTSFNFRNTYYIQWPPIFAAFHKPVSNAVWLVTCEVWSFLHSIFVAFSTYFVSLTQLTHSPPQLYIPSQLFFFPCIDNSTEQVVFVFSKLRPQYQ